MNSAEQKFELWVPVPGYEGLYEINPTGLVRKLYKSRAPRVKEANFVGKDGYKRLYLWNEGCNKAHLVHCLVAFAFNGPAPENHIVNHIDGNKLNNSIDNLEYVTYTGNILHAYDNNLRSSGEDHPWSKYSDDLINKIRERHKEGLGCRRLAKEFNISKNTIVAIIGNKIRSRIKNKVV